MSQNILGIDLGTSSIGISLRNPNIQGNLSEQLEYFSVIHCSRNYRSFSDEIWKSKRKN